MTEKLIEKKMKELAKKLDYNFHNIKYLKKAMNCEKSPNKKYENQSLSTFGDAILKFTLAEYLYNQGKNQEEITKAKSEYEKNETLCKLRDNLGIPNYAYNDDYFYNDAPENDKLPKPKHDIFMEAIIAAIYIDRGIRYCKKWIIKIWKKYGFL